MISRDLILRVSSAIPLVFFVCWFFFLANEIAFIITSIIIALIGNYELGSALRHKSIKIKFFALYLSVVLFFLAFWCLWKGLTDYALGVFIFHTVVILFFSFFQQSWDSKLILWYLLPVFWICLPITLLIIVRFRISEFYGSLLIFFLLLVSAFNDIFAYFGGKKFGKRPLAPTISPKKTIEGSVFGLLGGLLSGTIMAYCAMPGLFPIGKLLMTIIAITIASQIGDLCESKFKRYCQIKDSSNLIPGHGGLLDRIDGYLIALPVFIGILLLLGIHWPKLCNQKYNL